MERFLLQMAGRSGAGKTTLANAIGKATGAVVIDHDAVKSRMLDFGLQWDLAGRAAYQADFAFASSCLQQGHSVILDSACRFDFIARTGMELAQRYAACYGQIECQLSDQDEVRRRMANRSVDRSQWTAINAPPADAPASAFISEHGEDLWASVHPRTPWLPLDMSQPLEETLTAAIAYLEKL